MAERRENSVLFSLNELRNIEQDRVKGEEEAERARIEAERRAREEEIRRAKEAEEAKVRAEQDRQRREIEEKERIAREHDLRLKESERRAQIEAAAKLEQARIEAEARARIEGKKFPTTQVVGGVIALVLLAGGIMTYLVYNHNQEVARIQAEAAAKADAERKQLLAQQEADRQKLEAQLSALQGELSKAHTDEERAKIRAQMAATQTARARVASSKSSRGGDEKPASPSKKPAVKDTNDPLGGLGL
jgi:colicin import membrane protein